MKILVLSDTHGSLKELEKVAKKAENIDLIIHLGDYSKDVAEIKKFFNIPVINVKGNCDILDTVTPDEDVITIKDKRILLTHGDKYRVKRNLNGIFYRAKELSVDVALFGHSHISAATREDNILLLNPGSISLPRAGNKKSFGIIDINDEVMGKIVEVE